MKNSFAESVNIIGISVQPSEFCSRENGLK